MSELVRLWVLVNVSSLGSFMDQIQALRDMYGHPNVILGKYPGEGRGYSAYMNFVSEEEAALFKLSEL